MLNVFQHHFHYTSKGQRVSVPLAYLLVMLIAVGLCLTLAYWQWQRAMSAQSRYQQFQQQGSIPLAKLNNSALGDYRSVIVEGEIEQIFLLDNQIYQGQAGRHVLVVITTPEQPMLVNLGWQPNQAPLPQLTATSNHIQVRGLIKRAEVGFMLQDALEDPNWPVVMQQIDLTLLNDYLGYSLSPYVLYAESSYADLVPAPLKMTNKFYMHLGYAIQWLLIAAAGVISFVYVCKKEQQHENH